MISFITYFTFIVGFSSSIDLDSSVITLEGDTLILRGFEGKGDLSSSALSDKKLLWPSAQVFYLVDPKFSVHEKKLLVNVINEIETNTCLIFTETSEFGAYLNITRTDLRGCESFIGYKGEMQEMFLNKACFKRKTLLHEMMHALGFVHEHTRPDRDEYIDIIWENIEPTEHAKNNFLKREGKELAKGKSFSTYAYDSVMHYGSTFFSKNDKPTIVPKRKGVKIGGENHLAAIDIQRINELYNCSKSSIITAAAPEEEEKCFNDHQCCYAWKETGECDRNSTFMIMNCKASCAVCSPKYNLDEDCSNRYSRCEAKMKAEGCKSDWMKENCRLSCSTCSSKDGLLDKCITLKVTGQCRSGWALFKDNCYLLKNESISFSEAQDVCVDSGAYLSSVHSTEEKTFIVELMKQSSKETVWIGTYKDTEEDTWLNIDDTELNIMFWDSNMPKADAEGERCAAISAGGIWKDVECGDRLGGFICKKKKQQK